MKSDNTQIKPVTVSSKQSNPKSGFQTLWDKAEKLKLDNLELETSLDNLVLRIQTDIAPVEIEMGRTMREQIDKLITFAGRKSLAQWQIHVLDEWIMSTIDTLQSMGLVDDALNDNLAQLQAQAFGIDIDSDSDLSAAEQLAIGMDAHLNGIDIHSDDAENIDDIDDAMEWFEAHAAQLGFADDFNEHADWEDANTEKNSSISQPTSAQPETVFKTLFHRVARALHPDKEADPQKREVKQALMAQLLEARRKKDLMQVFRLYQEHVADTSEFGEQELAELETVLIEFIELEVQRRADITTKSYLHELAFAELYSNDSAKVDRAIGRKIKEIEKRKKEIETFTKTVSSLQKLKPYLEARYDQLTRYY